MTEENWDLKELKLFLKDFAQKRDWEKFHTPKNLSMALSVEASELAEIFQWLTEEESKSLSEEQLGKVKDEVADVMVYLLRICTVLDISLPDAIENKMKQNAAKYPADLVRGSAKKYTEYEK